MGGKYEEASLRTKRGVTREYRDDMVYVGPSKMLESRNVEGVGLYAARTLRKGEVISEYLGVELSKEEALQKTRALAYMFDVKKNGKVIKVIDGANAAKSSVARYVNAANTLKEQNADFKQWGGRIYLVTDKKIRKDSEILAWYGNRTVNILNQK